MELFTDEKASSIQLLKLWVKHFRLIIIFTIIGLLLGLGVTFLIPKKYYSYATIFPPNSNLGLNVLEDPRFGNSLDADQLMQLLESRQVMDSIVKIHNLEEYYEIDKRNKGWKENLQKYYYRDIRFNKTRYYSIVITATLKDAELASDVVNSIVDVVDEIRLRIIRENQTAAFEYAKLQYSMQQLLVDSLKNQIYTLKKSDDPNNILYNHLMDINKTNAMVSKAFVTSQELETLVEAYVYELEKLKNLKGDYDKAVRLIQKPLSRVFVVNRAKPNYKKVSPSFLINGLIGLGSSFIFILLFVVIRSRYSSIMRYLKE